jgi:stage V sporulation protein B
LAASDTKRIERIIKKVFKAVLSFSICIAGIMMCFGEELGKNIYPSAEDAGKYIIMIAPLIPIMYIDTSVDSILKGLGEQMYCMVVNIIDSGLSVILVVILLPKFGITGYFISFLVTHIINFILSLRRLLIISQVAISPIRAALTLLCLTLALFFGSIPESAWAKGILYSFAFGALLIITKVLTKADLKWFRGLLRKK